jgi:hypothetical protein
MASPFPVVDPDMTTPAPVHAAAKHFASGTMLVGVDAVLFAMLGILAYIQFRKARTDLRQPGGETAPVSVAGGETRLLFMGMLSLSNISRAITLCIEGITQQDKLIQKSVRTWVRDFLMSLPTLFFLTTYSVVILFWAQVYYASVLVSFPLLKPIVVFINIAAYVVFAVIACLTLLLMAWSEFRQYLYFLLGILFLFCGFHFFYYGVKVSAQLLDRNKQLSRKSRIIRRVIVLTSTVPIILISKGVYCTAVGVGFLSTAAPWDMSRLTWDCTNFFLTEFIPSVLMLLVFWPGSPRADAYEPPSSLLTSREGTLQSLESPLIQQQASPSSEKRHPHLMEAQSRLEFLASQAKQVQAPSAVRGISTPSASPDIGPGATSMPDLLRPWNVKKPAPVSAV